VATPQTRTRLIDAAYELLVQDGYHATTVQGIARRAGLTTGAIYANFANKQELMALAVLDRWTHLQQQLLAIAAEPEGASGRWPDHHLVHHIAQLLTAPAAPEHRLLTEVTGAVLRDSGAESPLLSGVRMLESMVQRSIEQAKKDGGIDGRLATDAIVAVIVNLYLGTITSKAWGLDQPGLDDVTDVLSAINRGLALGPADT
jgi:AcrR family transcriptional regulator